MFSNSKKSQALGATLKICLNWCVLLCDWKMQSLSIRASLSETTKTKVYKGLPLPRLSPLILDR